jgi:hypothetical protein
MQRCLSGIGRNSGTRSRKCGYPLIDDLGSLKRVEAFWPGIILKSLVKSLTCRYCNLRDRIVVLRCRDSHHATLERVLFPLQSLQFQFSDQGVAEIWTHGSGGAELLDRCPMQELSCSAP